MRGEFGPYINDDGDVWVPRVVPYLEARRIAQVTNQDDDRLVYRGKADAELLGFSRDCLCLEICEATYDDEGEPTLPSPCRVPAWHFELVER